MIMVVITLISDDGHNVYGNDHDGDGSDDINECHICNYNDDDNGMWMNRSKVLFPDKQKSFVAVRNLDY